MTRRLIIRAEAEADMTDAALWYENQQRGLGEEFISEMRTAIDRALTHPGHHRRLRRRPEVRRVLTARFPYPVFFILRPDAIIVFRVLHGARHDREWKSTLPTHK
jgi:plasmid stabilization system protein ParE